MEKSCKSAVPEKGGGRDKHDNRANPSEAQVSGVQLGGHGVQWAGHREQWGGHRGSVGRSRGCNGEVMEVQ